MHLLSGVPQRTRLSRAGIDNYRLMKNRLLGFTMDFMVLANCAFRRIRPPSPIEIGHLVRPKSAACSGPNRPPGARRRIDGFR